MHKERSWSNISRRKSSGNEEDIFFELCCAGPNRFKEAKNAVHTPGSFSWPEFLNKGAESQTVKQCALHAVAASLVRESGALHGVRVNAGFDVPLDDSVCLDGVFGILQVDAGALPSRCVPQCGQRESDSGRGCDALCDGGLRGSAASGRDCVAPGDVQLRVSAAPGSERDALCDAVVAAEAGSRNRKSVVSTSDCDLDSRSTSLCAVNGRPRSIGCARMNSQGLHSARRNSGGHTNSYRCTYNSCGGVREGTKPMSMSTRCQVGCLAVEKLASLQQAPGRLHVETWAGRNGNPSLPISQVVEIMSGCADMVTRLLPPFFSSVSCGPGREVRNGMGWSLMEKTAWSEVWLFRGALSGSSAVFAFAAFANWVKKGSFFAAWAVLPLSSCSCSCLYGRGMVVGPHTGEQCWPLLARLWRAIAPLMKPWCAKGDVPTAANLNLYRGRSSHVGWR